VRLVENSERIISSTAASHRGSRRVEDRQSCLSDVTHPSISRTRFSKSISVVAAD
jgi:hypothetical protein